MSTLDIRKESSIADRVVFSTSEHHGIGKLHSLDRGFYPDQFYLLNRSNVSVHVKYADIDNLIRALKYVRDNWKDNV